MFKAGTHGPLQCLILCDIDVNVMPRYWVLEIAEHILVGVLPFLIFHIWQWINIITQDPK